MRTFIKNFAISVGLGFLLAATADATSATIEAVKDKKMMKTSKKKENENDAVKIDIIEPKEEKE